MAVPPSLQEPSLQGPGARSDGDARAGVFSLALLSVPLAALSLPLVVMIPEYYATTLGVKLAVIGTIFTAVRFLDIVVDPWLGSAMDSTRTRWGRYKPWVIFGAPALMLSVYMLFMARPGVGALYLLTGLVAVFLVWSILSLAQLALAAGLSNGYDGRSKVYAWLQGGFLCGTVAVMAFPILAARLHATAAPTQLMGWVIIVLTAPAAAFAVWRTPQPAAAGVRAAVDRREYLKGIRRPAGLRLAVLDRLFGLGFGVASAAMVFFFTAVKLLERSAIGLLLIAQMSTAILAMPLVALLAKRLDKHVALGWSGILAAIVSVAFLGLPQGNLALAALAMMVWGVSYAAFTLLPRSMMADAGDELQLQSGIERPGILFALLISSWKLGGALSVGLIFLSLGLIGYRPALLQHNSPAALWGLQLLFAGPSALLFLIGAWLSFTHPLNRSRHQTIRLALAPEPGP